MALHALADTTKAYLALIPVKAHLQKLSRCLLEVLCYWFGVWYGKVDVRGCQDVLSSSLNSDVVGSPDGVPVEAHLSPLYSL
jgi:hypothetical protein